MAAQQQSLAGTWQFRQIGAESWEPASVPGGVHTDLLALGRIEDPFVGDAEKRVLWVAEEDWEYRRTFEVAPELLGARRLELVCDGLDTLAEVSLNGQQLGATDNMFRQYRWDVGGALRAGENTLLIRFRSPARYAAERHRERPFPEVNEPLPGASFLRKVPSHFGWDWGPHLAAIGIWRDIRLEASAAARLADVHLRQHHAAGAVTVSAAISAERYGAAAPLRAVLRLIAPDGGEQQAALDLVDGAATVELAVERPLLWWPNGYGDQPLYQVEVSLLSGEAVLDRREYRLGLRTIELRQQPDAWGQSFEFVVNGVRIFAKGANWIPADSFPTRVSPERLEHLLGSAAAAHNNMLRIWGGGYYEDEYLYDLCDRLGLLVWQDFMFACAVYPLSDPAMLATLRPEVTETVRRLRHRTCLALWCGNNEIETAWADWGWDVPALADMKAAYDQFFHHTLPAWVASADTDHAYWPSSPSSGVPFENPGDGSRGDIHQWVVWHQLKPFSNYRQTPARFVSEFGFQSLPCLPTVAAYAEPADWNMTSYIMEHHQRNTGGNGRIIFYMTETFRLPKDFPSLVYLSQLLQAEAMRIGVEHWRRDPACAGTLYWQLNDCWPVASWAGIDYYGRWKAMHYASRRFFAPLLLSVEDEADTLKIALSNDGRQPWQGRVCWSIETLDGARLESGEAAIAVEAGGTSDGPTLELAGRLSDEQRRGCVLVCELWQGDERLRLMATPFVPSKHLALADPQIAVEVMAGADELTITLRARSLARFVELTVDGADGVFSDNYFDLPAGRTVSLSYPLPAGWTAERASAALRVRSLVDSY
jgi:beta-mannosidase